jgi:hypothetical protein
MLNKPCARACVLGGGGIIILTRFIFLLRCYSLGFANLSIASREYVSQCLSIEDIKSVLIAMVRQSSPN